MSTAMAVAMAMAMPWPRPRPRPRPRLRPRLWPWRHGQLALIGLLDLVRNNWDGDSLMGPGHLYVANVHPISLATHRSGKPHGCRRGDSANGPPTLDPGAQVVSGLQHQAYGVSRRRRRGEREPRRHCPWASSWLGVGLAPKSVSKPPQRYEDHVRNECALRT